MTPWWSWCACEHLILQMEADFQGAGSGPYFTERGWQDAGDKLPKEPQRTHALQLAHPGTARFLPEGQAELKRARRLEPERRQDAAVG